MEWRSSQNWFLAFLSLMYLLHVYWGHWELISHVEESECEPFEKNITHTYFVKVENTSRERVYFDYCWNVINSDSVEGGKMGAMVNDHTDLMA